MSNPSLYINYINFSYINLVINRKSLQVFKLAKSCSFNVPCVHIQFSYKTFPCLKNHCFSWTLQTKIKFVKVHMVISTRNISLTSQFFPPVQGRPFLVLSKRPLSRLDIRQTLKEPYRDVTHLTLQCRGRSQYELSISSSKDRNCLCIVAERVPKKFTTFDTVDTTSLRAEFEIFAQRCS